MSDHDELLADEPGDGSMAEYTLGHEEEEQLLADECETHMPVTSTHDFVHQESVVPNFNPEAPTYAPYEPPVYPHPEPVILNPPIEAPQIVPSDSMAPVIVQADTSGFPLPRRQRTPRVRDIPDSLDKVLVPHSMYAPRGSRTTWRNPHYTHPYKKNNVPRASFQSRASFPPPQQRLPAPEPQPPEEPHLRPEPQPEPQPLAEPNQLRPPPENPYPYPAPTFRPNFPPPFQRPFMRHVAPNANHLPQVTIRQAVPHFGPPMGPRPEFRPIEQEVRMLPVLPPVALAGKKVLINPHFKGNFQGPVDGLPLYIPTRIRRSPPLSPTVEKKIGPVKDIDDAAERFIAEQRNALARAAHRKYQRPPPLRYADSSSIEIEIDNELVRSDDELLRRQEEFINANRAGLRRRMRSPSPVGRRSLSPRRPRPDRSPLREVRSPPPRHDEDSEYRRRVREQESLRERVLRAKEVRRRKNAVALLKQGSDREREPNKSKPAPDDKPIEANTEKDRVIKTPERTVDPQNASKEANLTPPRDTEPNDQDKDKQIQNDKETEKESSIPLKKESPERALTPPLPVKPVEERKVDYDFDDLDLILDDFEGILSDDEDSGRFKEKSKKPETPQPKPSVDLRDKISTKASAPDTGKPPQRQKIVFEDARKKEKKVKEKSPPKRTASVANIAPVKTEIVIEKPKIKIEIEPKRQRIIFDKSSLQPKNDENPKSAQQSSVNRRVVLQRRVGLKSENTIGKYSDLSKPNPGIFNRAIRNTIPGDSKRVVVKKDEPPVLFEESDPDDDSLLNDDLEAFVAHVENLPHGMTDTRLKTLAGVEVQNINLDKEERTAKLTFKSTAAAESFKKKFNNKMVAASRLSVTLL